MKRPDIHLLTEQDGLERCKAVALRILAHRWNSAREIETKLARKGFEPEVVASTMLVLQHDGWIDDQRYAESLVRSRARKKLGPLRIRQELERAGVSANVITATLAQEQDLAGELEQLSELCRKRIRLLARRSPDELQSAESRNKLIGYLLKQGYDYGLVSEVVKRLLKEHKTE
ncbi:MAG TPA: regulatory protein RecX [Thermoanaerobaculia bacterium]|nr:regulatory protein RecX [Thermoanaerobaculia bacterium]